MSNKCSKFSWVPPEVYNAAISIYVYMKLKTTVSLKKLVLKIYGAVLYIKSVLNKVSLFTIQEPHHIVNLTSKFTVEVKTAKESHQINPNFWQKVAKSCGI